MNPSRANLSNVRAKGSGFDPRTTVDPGPPNNGATT